MRLTFLGKFFAGALLLLLVGGMYFVLFPSEEAPDYTQPAQLTFEPEKLPFSADSEDEYRKSTEDVTTYCTFFENYGPSRGVPAHFDAYIPEDFQESVYYYQDPDSGEQYIPAYFIQPGGNGLDLARAYAEDELERLPGCVTPPDLGGSGGVILLGFPEGRSPGGQYVETWGEIWWDSVNLNPGQVSSQAGLESGAAPVVKVASFANLTASQASDPANQTFPLNIALQRGPGVIRLGRLEFADGETRIWLELVNLTLEQRKPVFAHLMELVYHPLSKLIVQKKKLPLAMRYRPKARYLLDHPVLFCRDI
jgi:hypothetical protein